MKIRLLLLFVLCASPFAFVQTDTTAKNKAPKKEVIPHAQSKPPGPALSPEEALKKFEVPPGFRVELVAAEPDIVNPVAMTFDERGRIWITESIEYPRRSAGPGKDRVKVLESTKGDGKFDKATTVIEGLNIPSGIAIGHGGVWVCNSPDILFYPFSDFANAKLGKPQIVVTGFGRTDTHELPNSLTWGPDGWLYGLNGVFNHSHVKHKGKDYKFTCALFRIHPKTKDFELFCEGTSNPWGLAFNDNGDAFVSACVIDHLWHLTETGYYHRQGGPYPPFTWKIGSIVKHKHQKAAYCGLCWFDSDAYPPEYREKMYMGNIHGGAINVDQLERDGATYFARPALLPSPLVLKGRGAGGEGPKLPGTSSPSPLPPLPRSTGGEGSRAIGVGEGSNFLVANDAWFMPVAQKVGPDGCLYILDWYDRYHCYQDANRDPQGIDRLKGRLYRVVYKDYKPAGKFDLNNDDNVELGKRLDDANIYYRELAQRILTERGGGGAFTDTKLSRRARLHSLWSNIGAGKLGNLGTNTLGQVLSDPDPTIRAWAMRAVGNQRQLGHIIQGYGSDRSPEGMLQLAIAAPKIKGVDAMAVLLDVLTRCGDDKLIPHIVWQNLHPLLEKNGERFLTLAAKADLAKSPGLARMLPRAIDRILGNASGDPAAIIKFIDKLATGDKTEATQALCLAALASKIQNNEIAAKNLDALRKQLKPTLVRAKNSLNYELEIEAVALSAILRDPLGLDDAAVLYRVDKDESAKLRLLNARIVGGDKSIFDDMMRLFAYKSKTSVAFRGQVLAALNKLEDPQLSEPVLKGYPLMEAELQPKAIELLTQRPTWAKALFKEIAANKISKDAVNVNQARRLLATKDAELTKLIEKHWGIPRDTRNPAREKMVAEMKTLFTRTKGDPIEGKNVFKRVCAQCHRIYGGGPDVGPDLTSNGRSDFDQLLSNIFDPSLVIGSGYQAVTVVTKKGLTISGLVVEDNAQRVVLKVQGGELKTFARADVEDQFTSKLSMMPEDLEKQLRPQEIVDLIEYLTFDREPDDTKAKRIRGTPR